MGANIDREEFDAADSARFAIELRDDLEALRTLLAMPGFGAGPATLGAELELSLVDDEGFALPVNQAVLAAADDPQLTLELNRFNLEYNLRPVLASGCPFSAISQELTGALQKLASIARLHGGRIATIGILPTLRDSDVDAAAMTDLPRYRAMSRALRALGAGQPFRIEIRGEEYLHHESEDVTLEGAATSFQLHLRVAADRFAALYNATQLATAPALAMSTNSPIFLGRLLWHETRVALFKQAVDSRPAGEVGHALPRVLFGRGWVRDSAYELFDEAVSAFPVLLPATSDDDPRLALAAGQIPALHALRLHTGTIWRWNRPVFDPSAGGHLRIEMRALPAGPTPLDMMASAAFLVGLSLGLEPHIERLVGALSFGHAQANFFQAAQFGPDATLLWPRGPALALEQVPVRALVPELLEFAADGLERLGVEAQERRMLLGVFGERSKAGVTGSSWQRRVLTGLGAHASREAGLRRMLQFYLREAETGRPVHEWPERL